MLITRNYYIKASDFKSVSTNNLEGVYEVKIIKADLVEKSLTLSLPNGKTVKASYDTVYCNKDCDKTFATIVEENNCDISFSTMIEESCGCRTSLMKDSEVWFVKDYEIVHGRVEPLVWSVLPEEERISVNGIEIVPNEYTFYGDKESLMDFETIKFTNEDGVTIEEGGWAKALMFNDKQKELLDKLTDTINECKENGITLVYDACGYSGLFAYRHDVEGGRVELCDRSEYDNAKTYPDKCVVSVSYNVSDYNEEYYPRFIKDEE